ncbi:MAG: hypothetical protein OEY49_20265, partial [Candidatus Heimdallarchaeota archaeon]|nr:hypothetical protein [Candidatus Heimdallarchaeota archaeon]
MTFNIFNLGFISSWYLKISSLFNILGVHNNSKSLKFILSMYLGFFSFLIVSFSIYTVHFSKISIYLSFLLGWIVFFGYVIYNFKKAPRKFNLRKINLSILAEFKSIAGIIFSSILSSIIFLPLLHTNFLIGDSLRLATLASFLIIKMKIPFSYFPWFDGSVTYHYGYPALISTLSLMFNLDVFTIELILPIILTLCLSISFGLVSDLLTPDFRLKVIYIFSSYIFIPAILNWNYVFNPTFISLSKGNSEVLNIYNRSYTFSSPMILGGLLFNFFVLSLGIKYKNYQYEYNYNKLIQFFQAILIAGMYITSGYY